MSENNKKNNDNNFADTVGALFKGMDSFITTKTIVGEPIKIDNETTLIPLADVSFGLGAGAYADNENSKNNGGGGMGGKINASSVLLIRNGEAKVINIKNQDAFSKAMDFVPELINKFKKDKKGGAEIEDFEDLNDDFESDFE